MSTYRAWQPSLHPTALRGPWGVAWGESEGAAKDGVLTLARDAVLGGFVASSPIDALARHGADASLERGPLETDEEWRARIRQAWDQWRLAGTHAGLCTALHLAFPTMTFRIVRNRDWTAPPVALWARYWLLVALGPNAALVGHGTVGYFTAGAVGLWGPLLIGGFTIGDTVTIGSTATPAQVEGVRAVLSKWQSARDRCVAVRLVDGMLIGTPGLSVGAFTVGCSDIAWSGPGGNFT